MFILLNEYRYKLRLFGTLFVSVHETLYMKPLVQLHFQKYLT